MTEFAQDNKISWEAITPELTSANYRVCWPQLESNIDSRATDLSEVGSYDLRDCLIPQVDWDAMHPPAADGTKFPRLPQPPAPIGDDALTKERALFNERKRIAAKAQNGERILRNQMARAFADIGSRISIPGTGLKTITTADQMSKMKAMCIPTLEDIRFLQAAIITWDASKDFESNVIARNSNIYLLNQANLCTQDYEKIASFIAATKGNVQITEVLKDYHVGHATMATQVYDEMIQFFREQLPLVQAAAAASASAMNASAKDDEIAALRLENAAFKAGAAAQANVATAAAPPIANGGGGQRNAPGRGGRGRGGRNQAARGPRTFHYCYKHGSRSGHKGSICTDMANDASYTQEMKNATGPQRLQGHDGIWYPGAN